MSQELVKYTAPSALTLGNAGFSNANPHRPNLPVVIDPAAHYAAINVEAQQNNPTSLLWWMKRIVALRKQHKAFSRGAIEFLHPDNRKVLAFIRTFQDEVILVMANLSRFAQPAELDLGEFKEMVPVGGTIQARRISLDRLGGCTTTLAP